MAKKDRLEERLEKPSLGHQPLPNNVYSGIVDRDAGFTCVGVGANATLVVNDVDLVCMVIRECLGDQSARRCFCLQKIRRNWRCVRALLACQGESEEGCLVDQ